MPDQEREFDWLLDYSTVPTDSQPVEATPQPTSAKKKAIKKSTQTPLQVLETIPLLKGLTGAQVKRILKLCTVTSHQAGEQVCTVGTPREEMYILFSGELIVVTQEGLRAAHITPVATVGELGFITNAPHTVTLQTSKPSRILSMPSAHFQQLLQGEPHMQSTVQQNVIEILTTKLMTENVRTRDFLMGKLRQDERLKDQSRRTEAALKLLAEEAGMTPEEASARVEAEIEASSVRRIIIVDDEPEMRRLIVDALSAYDVVAAGTGMEALQVAQVRAPDLVITDIKMPEMDGLALLKHLRGDNSKLPVVATSGFVDEEELSTFDFDGFLEKPFTLDQLRGAVESALATDSEGSE